MVIDNILVLLLVVVLGYSMIRKHNAYQSFINGVKKGLEVFMDMYPVMVAMFLAIQFLKQSELLMDCSHLMYRHIQTIPASIWPLIVFRPISGSASLALMIDIFKVYGPDSLEGMLASVIQSSTDTTLYVLTLYFGSIQIKNTKNALFIGLFADVVGISIAILLVLLFFSC